MGTYTGLTRLPSVVRTRRSEKRFEVHAEIEEVAGPAIEEHVCAICGDTSIVPTDCTRCAAPMRARGGAVEVQVSGRAASSWLAEALSVVPFGGIPLVSAVFLATNLDDHINFDMYRHGLTCEHNVWVCVIGLSFIVGGLFLYEHFGFARARSFAERLFARRAPVLRVADLPDELTQPARVRGRIAIERASDGSEQVFVTHGSARARLPDAGALLVRTRDGGRGALGNGESVEVRGVGGRGGERADAGGPYRSSGAHFVFTFAEVLVLDRSERENSEYDRSEYDRSEYDSAA